MTLKAFKTDNNEVVRVDSSRANKIVVDLSNKSENNKSRNLIYVINIRATGKLIFLISNIKKVFNCLNQAIIKTLIF